MVCELPVSIQSSISGMSTAGDWRGIEVLPDEQIGKAAISVDWCLVWMCTSVITSKAANRYQSKTGQGRYRDLDVLPVMPVQASPIRVFNSSL